MSNEPRRPKFFGPGEHDDLDSTGLPGTRRVGGQVCRFMGSPRRLIPRHRDDPLSPSFGVPHEDLAAAPSPPSGFVALHPAAVAAAQELKAAHDARVAVGLPGYVPDAEPTEPPVASTPTFDRTETRDSASTGSSRLPKPFLSVLRRAFSRE